MEKEGNLKNILIISAHYYPLKGGTPTHTENLCTELSNLGYNVSLITEDNVGDDLDAYDAAKPYRVIRLRTKPRFRTDTYFPILVGRRITRYIEELNPDIINISTGNYVPLGLKLSKKQKIPIVYTVHNVPPEEYTFNISSIAAINEPLKKIYFRFISHLAKFCMKHGRYNHIISVSERTKERLIKAGAKEKQITIVSNGVAKPKETYARPVDDSAWFTILVTAGIIEHKGQYELVLAMEDILKKIPNARCVLAGPIRSQAYADKIHSLIAEKGYTQNVILRGECSEIELENQYAKCDVYVQPSYQEGFCIAIMEAMIREKPVIGTAVGAIPELLADGRGIVVEKPEPKLIADAVITMYHDSEFRKKSAKAACEYVMKEYEWGRVAEETVAVYEKMICQK